MRVTAYELGGATQRAINRRPNEIVLAVDGRVEVTVLGEYWRPSVITSSFVVGLQASDVTVTLIDTGRSVTVGSIVSEDAGIHRATLVQRFHRFVAGGEPVPSSTYLRNDPPEPVPDGLYLVGVRVMQGSHSAACLASVMIEGLPLEVVDHEWPEGGFFGFV